MCDLLIVQNAIDEYVAMQKSYTSIDIANKIKTSGVWVRNREVAAYLRNNVPQDYRVEVIDVTLQNGSHAEANLYLPAWMSTDEYGTRAQTAIPPTHTSGYLHVDLAPGIDFGAEGVLGQCNGCGYTGAQPNDTSTEWTSLTADDSGIGDTEDADTEGESSEIPAGSSITFKITINIG